MKRRKLNATNKSFNDITLRRDHKTKTKEYEQINDLISRVSKFKLVYCYF